jgi:hypothetical protein
VNLLDWDRVMLGRLLLVFGAWLLAGFAVAETEGRAPAHGQLPASVDLMPAIERLGLTARLQGARDTCSLFAVAGMAEFEVARQSHRRPARFSEEFLIWAGNKASGENEDQAMFYKAVQGLNMLGICSEELMPYEGSSSNAARRPSPAALADAKEESQRWRAHWIKRWDVQCPLSERQMLAIRRALAARHTVACGLRWPKRYNGSELLEVPPPATLSPKPIRSA